jgi:hypothetical protein
LFDRRAAKNRYGRNKYPKNAVRNTAIGQLSGKVMPASGLE